MNPRKVNDPKMIGLWKVGRTLGKGFSGRVRIARHSKTGQYAAIKIIAKGSLPSRVSLNRLADEVEHSLLAVEREIVVMKLIDHPNIMKLYDVWETSSSLYLILEYVQGGELFEHLCTHGRLSTKEAVDYFQQLICAVDYCHRFNIAHRDLKLENVLIDQDANIKVADFGMAAWQDDARGKLLHTSCGSPHYAAPEIISGKPYNGAPADIWSCGIILHALLTARLPFDDDDCPTLLQKISVGKFNMPQDIDPTAQDLIARMLTRDVEKRITMREIMRHPFFTSQPLKNPSAMPSDPNIDIIARPIGKLSAIDPDIFANLRTLWHDTPDSEIIKSLLSPERNWQQGIYRLLVNYRDKYADLRHGEDEQSQLRLERKKSKQARKEAKLRDIPPRTGPPTPRRAKDRNAELIASESSFPYMQVSSDMIPAISLSVSSPTKYDAAIDVELPILTAPELDDPAIQGFFEQVARHLNVLQARTGSPNPSQLSSSAFSPQQIYPLPLVDAIINSVEHQITSNITRPLSVRQKGRTPHVVLNADLHDKENARPMLEADLIHEPSPLSQHRVIMGDLQVDSSSSDRRAPHYHKNRPLSPMFSDAGSSFSGLSSPDGSASTSPRRTWLDNVFKFKTATYNLLSRYDVHTTRDECRRLLVEMDMVVSQHESEKLGVLKCRSQDVKAGNNAMAGFKSVKFRVELQWPTPQLCHHGFMVSLVLIQEKGPLDAFKAIYQQLAIAWTLDNPISGSLSAVTGPSSTRAIGGRLESQFL
ncbi:kinase-like domain-containing protein [Panaeolus papilionaceus]|nr:kinase-like domain-containing protein [Panaeolus papilionaceus]